MGQLLLGFLAVEPQQVRVRVLQVPYHGEQLRVALDGGIQVAVGRAVAQLLVKGVGPLPIGPVAGKENNSAEDGAHPRYSG